MAPLAKNSNEKNGSRKIINEQLKVSQNSKQIEKKKDNNKNKKLKGKIDIISNIPIICSQEILLYLTKNDLASAWNCSRDWKNVMSGNYFWEKRCKLDGYPVVIDQNEKSKFFHQYVEKFDYYWHGVYCYYQMLFNNWKTNNFTKKLIRSSIHHCHYFDEHILIASSEKKIFKMIDSSTGNQIKTKLGRHKEFILEVFKIEDFLVSISNDWIIKVWDLSKNGICILSKKLPYALKGVFVSKDVIACGNMFGEVLIYDFKGTHIYSYNNLNLNNGEFVRYICIEGNIMAIGTQMRMVKIAEINSQNLARDLGHVHHLQKLMIKKEYLLCRLVSGSICVFNIKTMTVLHSLPGNNFSPVTFMNENQLISRGRFSQRYIDIWDFTIGKINLEIRNQYSMIYLASNSLFIVAKVNHEKAIKVWCCKTGKLITKISYMDIGLKDGDSVSHALITESKLVLRCYNERRIHLKIHFIILNFEKKIIMLGN